MLQTQTSEGRFWAVVLAHIETLKVMHRNRRGRERRHYSDINIPKEVALPCACNPRPDQCLVFRLFEDGELIHLGCKCSVTNELQKVMFQKDIWTRQIERLRVSCTRRRPASAYRWPYATDQGLWLR